MNHRVRATGAVERNRRRSRGSFPSAPLVILLAAVVGACGGGGGTPAANNATPLAIVKGQAVKGPIANGTVSAYAVTSGGEGASLGTTTTDASGAYSFALAYAGPLLLEITGGSYIDEATGLTVTVPAAPGSGLQAVVNVAPTDGAVQAEITPLSTIAVARAQAMPGGLTAANIAAANLQVGTYFGGIDILNSHPVNPLLANSATGNSQDAIDYGLILAGLSAEAQTLHVPNPFDLVTALSQDFSDGVFDGASGATPIQLNGSTMTPTAGTTGLAAAIATFSADTTRNRSAGTVSSTLITAIAHPPGSHTVGGTVSGLTGTLVLSKNGAEDLSLTEDGSFAFPTTIADGGIYNITVTTQPSGQTCSIANGSGTVGSADVVNVSVTCAATTVSVPTVTGLSQADAEAAITAVGLMVGTETFLTSATVAVGGVISQSQPPETAVALGTAINLAISSNIQVGTGTTPQYSWVLGNASAIFVVRTSDPSNPVWGINAQGAADIIPSPQTQGTVTFDDPRLQLMSAAEIALTPGVEYRVGIVMDGGFKLYTLTFTPPGGTTGSSEN